MSARVVATPTRRAETIRRAETKRHPQAAPRPAWPLTADALMRGDPTLLLSLQHSAGNAAVSRLIAGKRTPPARGLLPVARVKPLQRDPAGTKVLDRPADTSTPRSDDGPSVMSNPEVAGVTQALDDLAKLAGFAPIKGPQGGVKWEKQSSADSDTNVRYQEKHTAERDQIVAAVGRVHAAIAALTAPAIGVDAATLKRMQASFYARLNALTPYYTQMGNKDLLYTEKTTTDKQGHTTTKRLSEAWERTCNVTSMAMTLEALGVQIGDFRGNGTLMLRIAESFEVPELHGLRLPDFLQLVAIYVALVNLTPDAQKPEMTADAFAAALSTARSSAADLITRSGEFEKFTGVFGIAATYVSHDEAALTRIGELNQSNVGLARKDRDIAAANQQIIALQGQISGLEDSLSTVADKYKPAVAKRIGRLHASLARQQGRLESAQKVRAERDAAKSKQIEKYVDEDIRGTEAQIGKLEKRARALTSQLNKAKPARKTLLDKQIADLTSMIGMETSLLATQRLQREEHIEHFESELDASLPVDAYRNGLLGPLRGALDSGQQIIGNRVSHFVRVESVDESHIVIDDPADKGKNFSMTWPEARSQGFFRHYTVLHK